MNASVPESPEPALAIAPDTVCFIVRKLREYESLDLLAEHDVPANPLEYEDADRITEQENEYAFDPVRQELVSFIDELPDDQKIDLVALMWLGRSNGSAAEWPALREEAAEAANARTTDYLLGSPLVGDFLKEGLSALGYACDMPDEQGA
ncbi:MAG: DUF3775 domain-containing protein [Rhodanobacter sp.]